MTEAHDSIQSIHQGDDSSDIIGAAGDYAAGFFYRVEEGALVGVSANSRPWLLEGSESIVGIFLRELEQVPLNEANLHRIVTAAVRIGVTLEREGKLVSLEDREQDLEDSSPELEGEVTLQNGLISDVLDLIRPESNG